MSKEVTKFLDLEDLSLLCIFQYLSIRQRVALFVEFNHYFNLFFHLISKYFALGDIQTIELGTTCLNDEVPINDCTSVSQSLNKLVILYDNDARYKQIRTIECQIGEDLLINLFKIRPIFDILSRSPNLQTLKVKLKKYSWSFFVYRSI